MKELKDHVHPSLLVYFAEKGESMSDAHNIKGKCTHIAEDVNGFIQSLGSISSVMLYEGKEVSVKQPTVVPAGEIAPWIGKDAEANALNGWYARAIAAKTEIIKSLRNAPFTQFMEEGEALEKAEYPDPDFNRPKNVKIFTQDDVLAGWSANDLADFLIKEQYCATVGKLIHKKGKLHELYNTPQSVETTFSEMSSGQGYNKAYPVTHSPVYAGQPLEDIKRLYMDVHDEHREAEKKVNWYKAKLNNELTELESQEQQRLADELAEYNQKMAEYNEKKHAKLVAIRTHNTQLEATCEARRSKMVRAASNLKIFIPEVLRPIKKSVENYKNNGNI